MTLIGVLNSLVGGGGGGGGACFLYWDGSLKGLAPPMALAELLSCKLLSTLVAVKTFVLYTM
jgi:hypothetical protein